MFEDLAGERDRGVTPVAVAQEDREQFGILKRIRAAREELLAGSLVDEPIANRHGAQNARPVPGRAIRISAASAEKHGSYGGTGARLT
jgi:hypothetical protein